jgi:hypothetical protein
VQIFSVVTNWWLLVIKLGFKFSWVLSLINQSEETNQNSERALQAQNS